MRMFSSPDTTTIARALSSRCATRRRAADEQRSRLPNATFRDRMTLHVGGKEIQILYFVRADMGDSIVFGAEDRIAYGFLCEEFPNMAQGYGVSWLRVLDAVQSLEADNFCRGHGPFRLTRGKPRRTLPVLRQCSCPTRRYSERDRPAAISLRIASRVSTSSCRRRRRLAWVSLGSAGRGP